MIINPVEDKQLHNSFLKIKEYIGTRINTAVMRICIQRAYNQLKKEGKIN